MFEPRKPLLPIDPRLLMLFGLMDTRLKELQQEIRTAKKEILDAMVVLAK